MSSQTYLSRVHLLQTFQIFQDDFERKVCPAHRYDLHRSAMMRGPRIRCLHASTKEVFYPSENKSCVVDGIDVNTEEASRHLPGQALRKSC